MAEVVQFRSRDRSSVESAWARFAPSARLCRVGPELAFDWRAVITERISIAEYRLTASVASSIRPEGELFFCQTHLPGGGVRSGRQELADDRPWVTDGREISASWDGPAEVRALVVDRSWAQETARRITGDDGLRLRVASPVSSDTAAAQHWTRTVGRVADDISRMHDSPLIVAETARHALMISLAAFPDLLHSAGARGRQTTPAHATVRRAIAYIDEHAHEPITVDDVARATHISTRGLQYAFRRAMDITPREQLRRARMDGAHRALLRAGSGETVASIARRWGFAHPSRFAADYRTLYGCRPADDLSRR